MIRRIIPVFSLFSILLASSALALEEPEFDVLAETGNYEVRRYLPYLVAEVDVAGDAADNQAFRMLAGYIFGDNDAGEKMQMTAPVESRANAEDSAATYAFVMEGKYTLATLPSPNDQRVRLLERPARTVAVRKFSGRWTEANVAKNEARLLSDLRENGVRTVGDVELARYNSPFTPWFMRRNEIIVPIEWSEAGGQLNVAAQPGPGL